AVARRAPQGRHARGSRLGGARHGGALRDARDRLAPRRPDLDASAEARWDALDRMAEGGVRRRDRPDRGRGPARRTSGRTGGYEGLRHRRHLVGAQIRAEVAGPLSCYDTVGGANSGAARWIGVSATRDATRSASSTSAPTETPR